MAQGRRLLFAACIALIACLLLSGAQRLVGSDAQGESLPSAQGAQACLCSPSSGATLLASAEEGGIEVHRPADMALSGAGHRVPACRVHADANGNVLASGVSYLRIVHRAFALGDGFA